MVAPPSAEETSEFDDQRRLHRIQAANIMLG